jgi:hypothetical protein
LFNIFFYTNYFFKKIKNLIVLYIYKNIFFFLKTIYVSSFFFIIIIFIKIIYRNIILIKYFNKLSILLIFIYFVISTFLFLNKNYNFGKYTSSINRFWKRSYIIFWLLEFFVFFLFLALLLFHYSESTYSLDLKNLLDKKILLNNFNFYVFFITSYIIYNLYLILFFIKVKNSTYINLVLYILNIFIFIFLLYEFTKFYYTVNYYFNFFKKTNTVVKKKYFNFIYKNGSVFTKTRTIKQYTNLIILLKFWHVFFIIINYFFLINSVVFKKKITYNNISVLLTNFIILYIFNMVTFFYNFKLIFFFLSKSFFWFFIHFNLNNIYILFYEIINYLI